MINYLNGVLGTSWKHDLDDPDDPDDPEDLDYPDDPDNTGDSATTLSSIPSLSSLSSLGFVLSKRTIILGIKWFTRFRISYFDYWC